MEDKYFDMDEMMIDYSEMTSFNFNSADFLSNLSGNEVPEEYSRQPYTFKYGNFDVVDMLQSFFSKGVNYVKSL